MNEPLDLAELRARLARFAAEVPRILRERHLTVDLAAQLERELAMTDAPFTLAVVGQMRTGKSTLINALVGDDLAIPGVTETTATVNWFRYGLPERLGSFRAVWDDAFGTADLFPLSEKERWSGDSELAARTRRLEFYSQAEFLKRVDIVDTPGMGSMIDSHEAAARGFLLGEGRAERDTSYYGGVADCVVYVLPPVTRLTDGETLGAFRAQSRFLRSTPFDSVAVVHKWETLDHPAPWKQAELQAAKAFAALKPYVCEVLPVSGPLGRVAQVSPLVFWDRLLELVRGASDDDLEDLTEREAAFLGERTPSRFGADERKRLLDESRLPWPCFKTTLRFAAATRCDNGEGLRAAVREASGIDRLLDVLERRFFARAELIRSAKVFERASRCADAARGRLRNSIADLDDEEQSGELALDELQALAPLPDVRVFVERRLQVVRSERREISDVLRRLENETQPVREGFRRFERDRRAVGAIDAAVEGLDAAEREEILTTLGAYGDSVPVEHMPDDERATRLAERLDFWLTRRHGSCGEFRLVFEQVAERLEVGLRELLHS